MGKLVSKKQGRKAQRKKAVKASPTWTEAVLITVARHRDTNGELAFSESVFERSWKMPEGYERVWEQSDHTEDYQQRIQELLSEGAVVLKVIS